MADKKISQLTGATTPLAGTEEVPVVQSGSTVKVSVSNLTAGRQVLASAVGVNVSPATQLHAQGSNANLGTLELDSDASVDYVGLTMWTKKTSPNANSRNWQIAANYQGFGTFDILNSTTTTGNPTTVRLSMDNAGNTTLSTGDLIQGTAAKGVNFTANTPAAGMTSQLLNWYEEGTFTPTAYGETSAGTTTYAGQGGRYTRIGRQVTAHIFVSISAMTGTGNLLIGGLPFAAANVSSVIGVGACMTDNLDWPASGNLTMCATENQTYARLFISTDNAGLQQVQTENSGWAIYATLVYYV